MLSAEETIEYWREKIGLSRKGKNRKKRIKLREARKMERQREYDPEALGAKAVKNQRRKKRQMMRIQKGND